MSQLPRSPALMTRNDTALLVVDVQERLMPLMRDANRLVWNIRRLMDAASLFKIPVAATEQNPQGLGGTVAPLCNQVDHIYVKQHFSCREVGDLFEGWSKQGITNIVVTGIELHICIGQTVLDLLSQGFSVYLPVDALSSRHQHDGDQSLIRMRTIGAVTTTTEATLFEWCETAADPYFKQISSLAQEQCPPDAH